MAGASPQMLIKVAANIEALKASMKEGASLITATTAGAAKLAASLNGEKLSQHAQNIVVAIRSIGVETLTAAQTSKQLDVLERAMDKLRLTSQQVPPEMAKLAAELRASQPQAGLLQKTFGDLGTQLKATALGFISAQAIIGGVKAAFGALTDFVGDSVASFAAAEAAQKKMTTALQTAGRATPEVIGQMNALAKQFQNTTVYSDDLTTEMQALLIQIGNVMPGEMEKALKAATDLASGLGIDLETATKLVGKAFAGETGTLKRYGIVIDEAKLKAEGMPAVLEAIQARFGGQAQAETETYAGKVKQLANAWDDVKEAVGKSIVDDPLIKAALRNITEGVQNANGAAGEGKTTFTEWWMSVLGGPIAGAAVSRLSQLVAYQEQALLVWRKMNATIRETPPAMFVAPSPLPMPPGAIDVSKYLEDADEAQKKAKKSAEDYTKALKDIAAAQIPLTAAQQVSVIAWQKQGIAAGTMATALKVNTVAVSAYLAAHEKTTKALTTVVPVIVGVGNAIGNMGEQFRMQAVVTYPKVISGIGNLVGMFGTLDNSLGLSAERLRRADEAAEAYAKTLKGGLLATLNTIPQTLADALTGGGGVMGAIQAIASKIGSQIGASIGLAVGGPMGASIGAALGSMAGSLTKFLAPVYGALTNLSTKWKIALTALVPPLGILSWFSSAEEKINDLRDSFLLTFGPGGTDEESGFGRLAAQLRLVGESGDAMFQRLIKATNQADYQRAVQEITEALAKQEAAQDAATVSTEAGAQATIETATQAALALDDLNVRLAANAAAWGAWSGDVTGFLQRLATDIYSMPLPAPGGGVQGGYISPGLGIGASSLSPGGRAGGFSSSSSGTRQPIVFQTYLDRRVISEVVAETLLG